MADRELPQDIEVEKKLISALLIKNGEAIPLVMNDLKAEDFYRGIHRDIYEAILQVYADGAPPDALLVEDELRRRKKWADRQTLYSMVELEYSTARAEKYARIIREKAMARQLMLAGREIAYEAGDDTKNIADLIADAMKKILSIMNRQSPKGFEPVKDVAKGAFEKIETMHRNPEKSIGIPTKLYGLDKVTNGFQRSDLILLAARPSMGKTALALNMALGAAKAGKVVGLFSLEMSKNQVGNRLLSLESRINAQQLNTGQLTESEMLDLTGALERLSELPIYVDDTAGIGLMEMRNKARRLKHEKGLDFIVIDYLQLMTGSKLENRQQEISEISRSLKGMARDLEVPILALSQLSRNVEMRAEKKPQLSDLRESGSLEQDADIVMFLYRDEYYNRNDADNQNLAELIIAKNRNGPTTSVALQFTKEIMRFGDLTRREM